MIKKIFLWHKEKTKWAELLSMQDWAGPGFVGGFLGVILTASVAEYIRIEIQKEGYPNSVEKVLGMKQDEYKHFSVGWKQALAQVAIEPENYTGQTVKFLSTLSAEQANLMDIIAARVLWRGIPYTRQQ